MKRFLLLMSSLVLLSGSVFAESLATRKVRIQWEPIARAVQYEVEFKNELTQQAKVFISQQSEWVGELEAGQYTFRVRSVDKRGVHSPWSQSEAMSIRLGQIQLITPNPNQEFLNAKEYESIRFSWSKAGDSYQYIFKLLNPNEKVIEEKILRDNQIELKVPAEGRFKWTVQAVIERSGVRSEIASQYFTVISSTSSKPKLKRPPSPYVKHIEWTKPSQVQAVELILYRFNPKTESFELFKEPWSTSEDSFDFQSNWEGGQFKVTAVSLIDEKVASEKDEIIFEVANGDRSDQAESQYYLGQYLDRQSGFSYYGNYTVSNIDYLSSNSFVNSKTQFSGFMNSLRGGGGYFYSDTMGLRYHGALSIFAVKQETALAIDLVADIYYRKKWSSLADSRSWIGLRYLELPYIEKSLLNQDLSYEILNASGLQVGADYWLALKGRYGIKLQATYDMQLPILNQNAYSIGQFGGFLTYQQEALDQWHIGVSSQQINFSDQRLDSVRAIELRGIYLNLQFERGF